ncbi:anthocyanidin 3-O-glucosyltransferase 2-like [Malania oleifera]|uniref:anthocyanidin 3-O-glucosyltransferase 2-like n=1 Tax=Malania oleifera TaxID=397392 RepID=UPI0025AE9E1F|nr:anthocyanidin 3-O-glucosyltransferase 2-like [Malania oleifera]
MIGHLVSTVELANLLVDRDDRLSVTVLLMKLPSDPNSTTYINSLAAAPDSSSSSAEAVTGRIRFVILPQEDSVLELLQSSTSPNTFFSAFVDYHKTRVREAVARLTESDNSVRLAGFVVDLFCTPMMDIADEFGVPSYVFLTSGAAFLGLLFHLQVLHDEHGVDVTEFRDSGAELAVPSFANPVPAKVLPSIAMDKEEGGSNFSLTVTRRFRKAKGIMINTFAELESHALDSFLSYGKKIPPIYPVGPILNRKAKISRDATEIMMWLDKQPPRSVVFMCFGSKGSFDKDQIREIAHGLELSRCRFLWSLRRPSMKDHFGLSSEYSNLTEVLPEGFLERTNEIGRVVGWTPQMAVLSHVAIRGFMSHCGWNSILESMRWGVPIATWPMHAEQQLNAFEVVRELGLGVEVTLDYTMGSVGVVMNGEDMERGIRGLLEDDDEMREKVWGMREKSQNAIREGGSSWSSLERFIHDVMSIK